MDIYQGNWYEYPGIHFFEVSKFFLPYCGKKSENLKSNDIHVHDRKIVVITLYPATVPTNRHPEQVKLKHFKFTTSAVGCDVHKYNFIL